jgi:hypothetical protein
LLLYLDGRVADAVAAQERAVRLMVEDAQDPGVQRRLEVFRRAQRARGATSR